MAAAAEAALAAAEAATPEALREATRRCVEEATAREEAAGRAAESQGKELATLKREAVLELRKLRAMLEASGGAGARGSSQADFSLPPGESILDGAFAAAVRGSRGPSSAAGSGALGSLPPSLLKLLALEEEEQQAGRASSGSSSSGSGSEEASTVAALRQQVLEGEFRMRELRVALSVMEARCQVLEGSRAASSSSSSSSISSSALACCAAAAARLRARAPLRHLSNAHSQPDGQA